MNPRGIPFGPVLFTLLWGGLLFPWFGVLIVATMGAGAPGALRIPFIWTMLASVYGYPVLALISALGLWVTWFARRTGRIRAIFSLLPLLSAAGAVLSGCFLFYVCNGLANCEVLPP